MTNEAELKREIDMLKKRVTDLELEARKNYQLIGELLEEKQKRKSSR